MEPLQRANPSLRLLRCTRTHNTELFGSAMAKTRLFKNGNSQAVRIPAELAYPSWDLDLVIERHGDELRIRPARRKLGDVLGKLAKFSPGFMREGRVRNTQRDRDKL